MQDVYRVFEGEFVCMELGECVRGREGLVQSVYCSDECIDCGAQGACKMYSRWHGIVRRRMVKIRDTWTALLFNRICWVCTAGICIYA